MSREHDPGSKPWTRNHAVNGSTQVLAIWMQLFWFSVAVATKDGLGITLSFVDHKNLCRPWQWPIAQRSPQTPHVFSVRKIPVFPAQFSLILWWLKTRTESETFLAVTKCPQSANIFQISVGISTKTALEFCSQPNIAPKKPVLTNFLPAEFGRKESEMLLPWTIVVSVDCST